MDSAVVVAIVMAGASVVVALVGGGYTFRAARRNAEATREVERDKLSTASWEAQVKSWREDVVTLREQRAKDLAAYELHMRDCSEQIKSLTIRVDNLVRQRTDDERRHRRERLDLERRVDGLTAWGRQVVAVMRERGVPFPTPPPGVVDTDPRMTATEPTATD